MSETPKTKLDADTAAKATKKVTTTGKPKAAVKNETPKKTPLSTEQVKEAEEVFEAVVEALKPTLWAKIKKFLLGA
jgi:3-hydroxyacyl-CoA dehydrogenase